MAYKRPAGMGNYVWATAGNGLASTYYDNIDFTGPVATRTDQTINFLWNNGQSPISGIAATGPTFSAVRPCPA